MVRKRTMVTTTKYEIIEVAAELFLTKGYTVTSPRMIADELGLSTGNITYYFPAKTDLLAVIVKMLCEFQWKMLKEGDNFSIASLCMEMMTVAAGCEQNEVMRDFFVSAFQSEPSRTYLRDMHIARAKHIFLKECAQWTEEQFVEAEVMIMGIQYAAISTTDDTLPLEARISKALDIILELYNVNEKIRQQEIDKALKIDCRGIGKRVVKEFAEYIKNTNEHILADAINENREIRKSRAGSAD